MTVRASLNCQSRPLPSSRVCSACSMLICPLSPGLCSPATSAEVNSRCRSAWSANWVRAWSSSWAGTSRLTWRALTEAPGAVADAAWALACSVPPRLASKVVATSTWRSRCSLRCAPRGFLTCSTIACLILVRVFISRMGTDSFLVLLRRYARQDLAVPVRNYFQCTHATKGK